MWLVIYHTKKKFPYYQNSYIGVNELKGEIILKYLASEEDARRYCKNLRPKRIEQILKRIEQGNWKYQN